MLQVLFGDIAQGRLQRLPFLGYWLLAMLLAGLASLAIILLLGDVTMLYTAFLGEVRFDAQQQLTLPGLIGLLVVGVLLTFSHANLGAKRYRDMGLNGWVTFILASLALGPLAWFFALVIPTDLFRRRTSN